MRTICLAALCLVSCIARTAPVTNSNGSVSLPNSEVGRHQPVVVDVSALPSASVTNGLASTGYVDSSVDGLRGSTRRLTDLSVYRKAKDCWEWRNWDSPDADAPAPADFLGYMSSPGSDPIRYEPVAGAWYGAVVFWPDGKLKYGPGEIPPGGFPAGPAATNVNFAMYAYARDGVTELYRFGATASRTDPTNETLVCWSTNAVNGYVRVATTDNVSRDIDAAVFSVTGAVRSVDGAARPLPKYLHEISFDDTYRDDAEWYYAQAGRSGGCSARRSGGLLERNYDWEFDDAAEFVIRVSATEGRYASIGVANVGTNLTENHVTSGKWSRYYKCLPGHTLDGINEAGVAVAINVTGGAPQWATNSLPTAIHPLAAVRFVLDNAPTAGIGAATIATRIRFPEGWTQNFHYIVADSNATFIVENGRYHKVTTAPVVMTNYNLFSPDKDVGEGKERYRLLDGGASITNAWFTRAYLRSTDWVSDFRDATEMEAAKQAWETHEREELRGHGLWQSVHTSVYDITNRVLRVAVQEVDDWYSFAVPVSDGVKVEVDPTVADWAKKPNPAPVTDLSPVIAYTTAVSNKLEASKQDVINDLDTVRAGATAGSTAVQRGGDTMTGKLTISTGSDMTTGFRARMNDNNWIEYKSGNIQVRRGTVSGTRVFTFPEESGTLAVRSDIPTSLSSLTGDSTHRLVTDAEKTTWSGKQDAISDLSEIRAGATAGATAVQPAAISDMATKTYVSSNYLTLRDNTISGASISWDGGKLELLGGLLANWIETQGLSIEGKTVDQIADDEIDLIVPGYVWDFQESIYNTPTTLSGYGITDAKIENGTITLGSNSITPVASLENVAMKNGEWAYTEQSLRAELATALGDGTSWSIERNLDTGKQRLKAVDTFNAEYTAMFSDVFGADTKHVKLGDNTESTGEEYSTAVGDGARATGKHSFAIGAGGVIASGEASVAIGNSVGALARYSTALGYCSWATTNDATALGGNTYARGERSLAAGWAASVDSLNATALGNGAQVLTNAIGAVAIGSGAVVGNYATNAVQLGFGVNNDPGTLQFMGKKVLLDDLEYVRYEVMTNDYGEEWVYFCRQPGWSLLTPPTWSSGTSRWESYFYDPNGNYFLDVWYDPDAKGHDATLLTIDAHDSVAYRGTHVITNVVHGRIATTNDLSHANPVFSNEVLAVQLSLFDTNTVAVLNDLAGTVDGIPLEGGAASIGALLVALAAAVASLKKDVGSANKDLESALNGGK